MLKRSAFLAFVLSAVLALPAAAPASAGGESSSTSTRSASAKGCWYYSDNNYQGARAEIVEGNPVDIGAELNDKISSISCHPLCTLTAYDGAGQSGTQKKFNGDISYVGDAWNDKISSMAVTCRRRVRSM